LPAYPSLLSRGTSRQVCAANYRIEVKAKNWQGGTKPAEEVMAMATE
jgi:hypothetical protein